MAAMSPTSPPTIPEHPKEEVAATIMDGFDKKLNGLFVKSGGTKPKKKKPLPPASNLAIHPTPYMNVQSPIFNPQALAAPPNNERSYLLENRQRQHDRGQRLTDALHSIETRISSTQSKGEGRKLRKEAGLLKKKITESQKQENLITLRLNDIQTDEMNRNPYWQAQSAGLIAYPTPWSPYSPMTPWSPMTMPTMSPIHGPVSPLTPLPPGLYHPSPIMPSPLNSPYWLGGQFQYQSMFLPYMQHDQAYYSDAEFQQPYMPDGYLAGQPPRRQSMAPTVAKLREAKQKGAKTVDFELTQEGEYRGRRWSLADTFSPTPKDKRMSMPGLETIWKKEKEE